MFKKSLKQILAWVAIILLAGIYAATLVFSLIRHPLAQQLFHASLYCTVFIPVMAWVFLMTVRLVKNRGNAMDCDEKDEKQKPE